MRLVVKKNKENDPQSLVSDSIIKCPICNSVGKQIKLSYRKELDLHKCKFCLSVYRNTYSKEILNIYDDQYYDYWGLENNFDDVKQIKIKSSLCYLQLLQKFIPQSAKKINLLDIGCAHGFMLEVSKQFNFESFGIDISPAITIALKKGYTVFDSSLIELNLPSNKFDVITMIDTLEHIPAPSEYLKEIYRVLRNGGHFLILTPNVSSIAAKLFRGSWPHFKEEHLIYFNKSSLVSLLEKNNLEVKMIQTGIKYLSIRYISNHFQKYSKGIISSIIKLILRFLSILFKENKFKFRTELLVIAKKV